MNLADPELELIDPTPDIHSLFVRFDALFFFNKLIGRAVVRWSKRMYSSAGACCYEGRNGICDIALSEPLLKLRPRKNLVETLLHEMIHAFLYVTTRDADREAHGPNFLAHMYRINKAARLNITVYHSFLDEVELYLKHWWRCDGKCQNKEPFFGVVRRSCNRAPGPSDSWWERHQATCGGTFNKVKEPEQAPPKQPKTLGDITNNNNTIIDKTISKTGKTKTKSTKKHKDDINVNILTPPSKIRKIDEYFKNTATTILNDLYGEEFLLSQPGSSKKLKAIATSGTDGANHNKVEPANEIKDSVKCPSCNCDIKSKDINGHLDECLNRDIIARLTKNSPQVTHMNGQTTDIAIKKENHVKVENDDKTKKAEPDVKLQKREEPEEGASYKSTIIIRRDTNYAAAEFEPSTSTHFDERCPICTVKMEVLGVPIEQHLQLCLWSFMNNTPKPQPKPLVVESEDEDDEFDESQTHNATGTKVVCPCCFMMIEIAEMNAHLDICLGTLCIDAET